MNVSLHKGIGVKHELFTKSILCKKYILHKTRINFLKQQLTTNF